MRAARLAAQARSDTRKAAWLAAAPARQAARAAADMARATVKAEKRAAAAVKAAAHRVVVLAARVSQRKAMRAFTQARRAERLEDSSPPPSPSEVEGISEDESCGGPSSSSTGSWQDGERVDKAEAEWWEEEAIRAEEEQKRPLRYDDLDYH